MENKTGTAWLILIISLIFTLAAAMYVKVEIDKKDETEFIFECREITSKLNLRIHAHAQLLLSGAAFIDASDTISRKEWHYFITKSKVNLNLPGILGTGLSLVIPKNEIEKHTTLIKKEGFQDYKIWPEYSRETYTSIVYVEPFSEYNRETLGYDMMTDSLSKKAMDYACDYDAVTISKKLLYTKDSKVGSHIGYLMYAPIYKKDALLKTIEQRKAAIEGWIYGSYLMEDLMSGIMNQWILNENKKNSCLQIYDGKSSSSDDLLYESSHIKKHNTLKDIRFSLTTPLDFNGHKWSLKFTQHKRNIFVSYFFAWLVFILGTFISLLFSFLIRLLFITKE